MVTSFGQNITSKKLASGVEEFKSNVTWNVEGEGIIDHAKLKVSIGSDGIVKAGMDWGARKKWIWFNSYQSSTRSFQEPNKYDVCTGVSHGGSHYFFQAEICKTFTTRYLSSRLFVNIGKFLYS